MLEQIILGIIQGIVEWLPVSSEGILVLVRANFFNRGQGWEEIIREVLFLHLGTFFAALIYFRKDVWQLVGVSFGSVISKDSSKKLTGLFKFLLISAIITGLLGYGLLEVFVNLEEQVEFSGKIITLSIGLLLLITAFLQIRAKKEGYKKVGNLKIGDSFLLGIIQGLAVLPGLSRSGLTVSTLLLRKFNSQASLKLSFLMSLPVVLGGNIILNFKHFVFSADLFLGLISSFVFGLLTISLLLKLARKINFGYFVLVFGILVIMSVFI